MKNLIASIKHDVAYAMYARQFEQPESPATRWTEAWEYLRVTYHHLSQMVGTVICRYRGHANVQVEEYVACERDAQGRITDIDGGRVDWYCPRCGASGGGWF